MTARVSSPSASAANADRGPDPTANAPDRITVADPTRRAGEPRRPIEIASEIAEACSAPPRDRDPRRRRSGLALGDRAPTRRMAREPGSRARGGDLAGALHIDRCRRPVPEGAGPGARLATAPTDGQDFVVAATSPFAGTCPNLQRPCSPASTAPSDPPSRRGSQSRTKAAPWRRRVRGDAPVRRPPVRARGAPRAASRGPAPACGWRGPRRAAREIAALLERPGRSRACCGSC